MDLEKLKFLDNIDGLIQDVYNAAKKQFAGLLNRGEILNVGYCWIGEIRTHNVHKEMIKWIGKNF